MMLHLMVKARQTISALLITSLLFAVLIPTIAHSQDLSNITVLLLNGKSNKEHMITVKNPTGLSIKTNGEVSYSYQTEKNQPIGLQMGKYQLEVIETTDFAVVNNLFDQIKGMKELNLIPSIEVMTRNNQVFYRLLVGAFFTLDEQNFYREKLFEKLNLETKPVGSLYLATVDNSDNKLLQLKMDVLRNFGFRSYLANVYENGNWVNKVFVGGTNNKIELQNLKEAIAVKFPAINLEEEEGHSYVIEKENIVIENGVNTTYPVLAFSEDNKITISPLDTKTPTLVNERRYQGQSIKYRGELFLQLYKDELALTNSLSMESYLYAVVGSEMYAMWPIEALKAQAVAARTFAYRKVLSPRNEIANIVDTTEDQAYYGVNKETESVVQAVNETKGMVITQNNNPITAFYSSNAGGISSDGSEVWGSNIPYTSVKESPTDQDAEEGRFIWYRIVLNNGETGYVREDLIDLTESKNYLGLTFGMINGDNVNIRKGPSTNIFSVLTQLSKGEEVVILDKVHENNQYSWIAGPFTPEYMTENVNKYQLESLPIFTTPILDLQVEKRGPSGRVTLLANGDTAIPVKYPDYYRTLLGGVANGIQSTLFDVEQTGRIEVLGANGVKTSYVNQKEQLYVISNEGIAPLEQANNSSNDYMILNVQNQIRVATKDQSYIIHGKGFGHGIGMSQWGAKGLAEDGYNYQQILQYYYKNIEIKKIY